MLSVRRVTLGVSLLIAGAGIAVFYLGWLLARGRGGPDRLFAVAVSGNLTSSSHPRSQAEPGTRASGHLRDEAMYPRPAVILMLLLCLCREARAADPLSATLPAESTTAAQRRTAALKLAQEAVKRLEDEKPSAPALQEQLFTEAIDDYQRLVEESGDKLLPLDAAGRRHCIQARWLTALDLSRLPAPALRVYRNRVDNQARKWFEQARPIAMSPCCAASSMRRSVPATATTLSIFSATLPSERSRFDEAERRWRHIVRPAQGGLPQAARPTANRPGRPRTDLSRSDSGRGPRSLADPRPAVCGRRPNASAELGPSVPCPKAEGSSPGGKASTPTRWRRCWRREPGGGQEVSWPTFGGAASRGRVLPPDPRDPNRLLRLLRDGETHRYSLENHAPLPKAKPDAPAIAGRPLPPQADARRLAFHPVVSGPWVVTADGRSVTAHHAVSGAIPPD
jgi:hypothetical protein